VNAGVKSTLFLNKLKGFVPSIPDTNFPREDKGIVIALEYNPIILWTFPREDKGIVIALEYNPIILWTKCFIIC
jgi:hypothetical protein